MYFLNLSLAQFLAVFGSVAAISVALYLLDRSRRRQVVSTLRFWVAAEQPAAAARRHHIQQPWSLVLQLLGMALLLLAIAQLRFGTPAEAGRDHVLVLDTSAWMAARSGNHTLMDVARLRAIQYVRSLPRRDRVMLVRADGLATPATSFEADRGKLEASIRASEPSSTALHLEQALAFARHVLSQDGRNAGEIAFAGSNRTADPDNGAVPPANLRTLLVPDSVDNCGLRKIGLRRSAADPGQWEIFVSARNYNPAGDRTVVVSVNFGPPQAPTRVPVGSRRLTLGAASDGEADFTWRTSAAGILGVTLTPHDAFPEDDHVELELPAQPTLAVTVYSAEPNLLRPVLSSLPHVVASYRKPEDYRATDTGLVILDGFAPAQRPRADSVWIDPPAAGSPVPIRTHVQNVPFARWDAGDPLSDGMRAKDFNLDRASVFQPAAGDVRIGEVEAGPVVVARPGVPKVAVLGFHPGRTVMRYTLATPLLFANLVRWVSPEIFRRSEFSATSVGAIQLALDQTGPPPAAEDVKVTTDDGNAVPFTLSDRTVSFFSSTPGNVRVVAGDREYDYSLTLPELADTHWTPPAAARRGLPHFSAAAEAVSDIWPLLALLGGAALLAEYLLFARFRRGRGAARPVPIAARRPGVRPVEVRR
ncbi:MAG: vWA domain-containing protein [Bryobacteraceae bacterium]